jgi:hypothetical protein
MLFQTRRLGGGKKNAIQKMYNVLTAKPNVLQSRFSLPPLGVSCILLLVPQGPTIRYSFHTTKPNLAHQTKSHTTKPNLIHLTKCLTPPNQISHHQTKSDTPNQISNTKPNLTQQTKSRTTKPNPAHQTKSHIQQTKS